MNELALYEFTKNVRKNVKDLGISTDSEKRILSAIDTELKIAYEKITAILDNETNSWQESMSKA